MSHFNITQTNFYNESIELIQLFHLVRTICMKGLIPIICIIGISTNSLNILVLTKLRMRSLTNNYLLAVAVCDLFYGITLLLLTLRTYDKFEMYTSYMYLLPYIMAFGNLCSNTACWLTCAFTAERYIAVSSPILARKICTKENCKWIILVICLFTFSVTLPDFLSYTVKWSETFQTNEIRTINDDFNDIEEFTLNENQTLIKTQSGEILNQNGWPIIIIILVVIGPLIILSVFNGLLIKSIIKASKIRLRMTKKTNEVVLPKIRYGIICITESLTNYTKNNSEQINNNESHECYSFKNDQMPYRITQLKQQQQRSSKRNIVTRVKMNELINNNKDSGRDPLKMDDQDNLPSITYRSYNSSQKLFTIHQSRIYFNEKDRITLMLIIIVVTFCIFTMPSAILHLIKVTYINNDQSSSIRLYLAIADHTATIKFSNISEPKEILSTVLDYYHTLNKLNAFMGSISLKCPELTCLERFMSVLDSTP
ncbi:putative peptide (FMRFamide/neurokinin-3)-like receptor [Schistosoma mansoni]|uniref:putative peptide (FMRFamide/neurokinin-3)-like receptor n=1 Tax=Schistosoma mansoni TaxID=6183 RepID=UPI0001A6222D|nr:putative peptide (FMRFamide/neurokinin-3)-like receptor [Schistosoma mansoni]|eukprot:XP_018649362.1 putative peptide (FMRFamide/neurokinin-3)-like receptor [Schistosoma mansoni]